MPPRRASTPEEKEERRRRAAEASAKREKEYRRNLLITVTALALSAAAVIIFGVRKSGEAKAERARREAAARSEALLAESNRLAEDALLARRAEDEAGAREERDARNRAASAELAERERSLYIARNLRSTNSLKAPGRAAVILGVMRDGGAMDEALASALSGSLPSGLAVGRPFAGGFAEGGAFERTLKAEGGELDRLPLGSIADYALLGRTRIEHTNADGGYVTARLRLEVGVIDLAGRALVESAEFEAPGYDATERLADAMAQERLIRKFAAHPWRFDAK